MPNTIRHHAIAAVEVRFAAGTTEGTFSGYASTFNDLVPSYRERVLPGAFTRTLSEWRALGKRFPILAAHDPGRVIGLIDPANLIEDERGLRMNGAELVLETQDGREHYALIKRGLVSLSIGFWPVKTSKNDRGETLIEDAELAEISVVYAGASPNATITEIRSQDVNMPQAKTTTEQNTNETTPEQRSQAVPQPTAEVTELRSQLAELRTTVEEIEVRSQRPGRQQEEQPSEARAAFGVYLRHGNGTPAEQIRALTVSSDPNGGYLAPAEMSTEFLRDLVEFSPVRSVASVRSTAAPSVSYPKRTSGTNAKWKGETQAQEESTVTFGQAEIEVKEINTFVDISNQLLADSAGQAEAEVRMALAEDFGKKEGAAFVNGDGVLQPKGFMNETAIAFTLNGHATNLAADALISLLYAQPAAYRNSGAWGMNGSTLATIRKLKDGQGNYLWQPAYQAGQPETILGRPVVEMVDMPNIAADAFPVIYGDFQAYRIVDRVGLSILVNPYLLATNGITRIHATRRVGGGVLQAARFRKLKMAVA